MEEGECLRGGLGSGGLAAVGDGLVDLLGIGGALADSTREPLSKTVSVSIDQMRVCVSLHLPP